MVKYVKAICGYREDQEHSVPLEEAHKLYRLFQHPEERAIFNDGLALVGSDLRKIVPDYHRTMGWNPTHQLDTDDWNDLRSKGVDTEIRDGMEMAKNIALSGKEELLKLPLSEVIKELPKKIYSKEVKRLSDKFKIN